jgi:cell division protein FtsI (penicillin-binding protein 3)
LSRAGNRAAHVGQHGRWRRIFILAGWLSCSLVVALRAGQIQVLQAGNWAELAQGQQEDDQAVPAPRGTIFDRNGQPLAVTRERVRVNVAPRELKDAEAAQTLLSEALGLSRAQARRLVSNGKVWNVVPGLFAPSVRERLEGVSGIHLEPVFERFHPHRDLARGALGVVIEDEGRGGVEQIFHDLLRGTPGVEIVARDPVGRPIPGERVTVQPPRAGGEVVLTIDTNLQEIAQAALQEAIDDHDALGGDIILTSPKTGEILALASIRDGHPAALSAVNTSFEPGSTLKPFTVAGLLKHRLASMSDSVDAEKGRWVVGGRVLTDTHTQGMLTVHEALRESSNIGIAKVAEAMSHGVQYENLRDFGFGTPTGVQLPGEVAGTLRRPERWSGQSAASLAIGYEIAVTPLQMAMAYGSLANGGVLMAPRLVREIRHADGTVIERFEPEEVRRVVDRSTAEAVGRALEDVVREGTGSLARVGSFRVAGKTGTARFSTNGSYAAGDYSASFVGYFPAEKPQLVVFVKLDRPRAGGYYGGSIAAPVTRETMEAALAAAPQSLDMNGLAAAQNALRDRSIGVSFADRPAAALPALPALPPLPADQPGSPAPAAGSAVAVPDVTGLPARTAVRYLHRFGLRVAQVGEGEVVRTSPPPGTRVMQGDTVRLRYRGTTHE